MLCCFSRPWELSSALESGSFEGSSADYDSARYMVAKDTPEVHQAVTGQRLIGQEFEWKDEKYILHELPGPAVEGDSAVSEKILISEHGGRIAGKLILSYPLKVPDGRETFFDSMLNLAYFTLRDVLKADKVRPPIQYWGAVCESMMNHFDDDPAHQGLIVDIALDLPRYMDTIIMRPKRALRRVRDLERIQRVREIDKACIINLARRPGTGIAEKAGAKQRILSVRRHETRNILENRVVLHCCDFVYRAAMRYLSDHEHVNDKQSKRKRAVGRIARTAMVWRRSESLQDVMPLSIPCKQPNYVLLQNPHYSRVWNYYRQLVKNEEVRAKVWRWPRRLWSDVAAAALASLIPEWIRALNLTLELPVVEERVVGGLREFSQGRFLCDDIMPGPYILGRSEHEYGTLYIVDPIGLQSLYPDESLLGLLNMDYCLVWVWPGGRRLLPIYCLLADEKESYDTVLFDGTDAAEHLMKVSLDLVGIMLVRPVSSAGMVRQALVPERVFSVWDIPVSLQPGELNKIDMPSAASPLAWLMGKVS